jgi:hypothetical protein
MRKCVSPLTDQVPAKAGVAGAIVAVRLVTVVPSAHVAVLTVAELGVIDAMVCVGLEPIKVKAWRSGELVAPFKVAARQM